MTIEQLAKQLYTDYCDGVGGVAFNGDKLPDADTFFADTSKKKQIDAWTSVAEKQYPRLSSEIIIQSSYYLSGIPVTDNQVINLGNGMELRITEGQWAKLINAIGDKVEDDLITMGKALRKFEKRRSEVQNCIKDLTDLFYHGDENGDFMFRTDISEIEGEKLQNILDTHRKILGFE